MDLDEGLDLVHGLLERIGVDGGWLGRGEAVEGGEGEEEVLEGDDVEEELLGGDAGQPPQPHQRPRQLRRQAQAQLAAQVQEVPPSNTAAFSTAGRGGQEDVDGDRALER